MLQIISMPVTVCHNMRISRARILQGRQWRGHTASMRQYFYGVEVPVLTTANGIPVELGFVPAESNGDISSKATDEMTLEYVMKILAKHGTIVTKDEAEIILDFVSKISKIAVDQYLRLREKAFKD